MSFLVPHPERRSPRLKGHDYSQDGAYFVTMCTQDRQRLFGDVAEGILRVNDAGNMIACWWLRLAERFPDAELDAFVVMPNHLHGIIVIDDGLAKIALPRLVQWFKTLTTNEYMRGVLEQQWESFPGRLWQRSYHDTIIRDERALNAIRQYIDNNPQQWALDTDNPATWTQS